MLNLNKEFLVTTTGAGSSLCGRGRTDCCLVDGFVVMWYFSLLSFIARNTDLEQIQP